MRARGMHCPQHNHRLQLIRFSFQASISISNLFFLLTALSIRPQNGATTIRYLAQGMAQNSIIVLSMQCADLHKSNTPVALRRMARTYRAAEHLARSDVRQVLKQQASRGHSVSVPRRQPSQFRLKSDRMLVAGSQHARFISELAQSDGLEAVSILLTPSVVASKSQPLLVPRNRSTSGC
ncbi:hypothetical protein BDV12DRAFT_57142 [Aspergillus spectabilis]